MIKLKGKLGITAIILGIISLSPFVFADETPPLPSECPGTVDDYQITDINNGGEPTGGNDFIFAGDGNSTLVDGGNGDDCILIGDNNSANISGNNGNDFIIVGSNNQGEIEGVNGADTIIIGSLNSGEVSGDGENGDDSIKIGDDNSGNVFSGNGTDAITLGENNSGSISGGNGGDLIVYGYGNTGALEEDENDTIIAVPPAPSAEPLPGTFTSIQYITLSSDGAEFILYTTDGTTPDCESETGEFYDSPIPIFSTKTITAVGCTGEGYSSPVAILAYVIEKLEAALDDLSSLFEANVFVPKEGTETTATTEVKIAQNLEIKTASSSESKIIIQKDTVITRSDNEEFDATLLTSSETETGSLAGLASGVIAKGALQWGIPDISLQFSSPIMINIFVGADLNGQTLNVVRSVTGTGDWTSDGIVPPATCIVSDGLCVFQATKASFYASYSEIPPTPQTNNSGGGGSCVDCIVMIDGEPIPRDTERPEENIFETEVDEGNAVVEEDNINAEPEISATSTLTPNKAVVQNEVNVEEQPVDILEGVLRVSDNLDKGNLMLGSDRTTVYIKTSRDFNDLIGKNVSVSISGVLDNFTFLRVEESSGGEDGLKNAENLEIGSAAEVARVQRSKSFIVSLFASIGRLILRSVPFF